MGFIRALRLLMKIAARPELVQALLLPVPAKSTAEARADKLEEMALRFMQEHPILPGLEEDTWNHLKRIESSFACARKWLAELSA